MIRTILAIFQLLAGLSLASEQSTGLTRDGRWYRYNGHYVWQAGIDFQSIASRKNYDFLPTLDALRAARVNKIRIWAYTWFMGENALAPWYYADGKYDLDQWNDAYWIRMREFVASALDREIMVEFTIFAPYPLNNYDWWSSPSFRLAWNKTFNVNDAFSTNGSGHFHPQFFDLDFAERSSSGKFLRDYQQALVDKSVAELGGFSNVHFEIANEFPADFENRGFIHQNFSWVHHWADRVDETTSRMVSVSGHDSSGANVRGIDYYWDYPAVDILNFHFYTDDPNTISDLLHGAQRKGKVLQSNESHAYFDSPDLLDKVTRESWGCFVSGAYYHYFHRDRDFNVFATAAWRNSIRRLTVLRDVAESVRFWEMSPVDSNGNEVDYLLSQGPSGANRQLICSPGSEYVAYFWGDQTEATARISLPSGDYDYVWVDPRSGGRIGSGAVSGGGLATIPSPSNGLWSEAAGLVLVVRATTSASTGSEAPSGNGSIKDRFPGGTIISRSALWLVAILALFALFAISRRPR